jgi:tRNA-specific 2-thiouridylase
MYHTIGQRQGLGIGGLHGGAGEPWYVVSKDLPRNVLKVAQGADHPDLFRNALLLGELHWISGVAPELPLRCRAKTRYRQPDQDCILSATGDNRYELRFDEPQRAITPGQSAVLYLEELCLGGGVIEAAIS